MPRQEKSLKRIWFSSSKVILSVCRKECNAYFDFHFCILLSSGVAVLVVILSVCFMVSIASCTFTFYPFLYQEALWQDSFSGDHISLLVHCTGCKLQGGAGTRRGIATMHLAADGTRAAGNLEAHNQLVTNLSDQLCCVM